jgi:hypothetical protein
MLPRVQARDTQGIVNDTIATHSDMHRTRDRAGRCSIRALMLVLIPLGLAAANGAAWARTYQTQTLDGLTVRCTTVNTSTLPQAALERYDVRQDAERGLLSCVVQRQQPGHEPENVPARVSAQYHVIGQPPDPIEIREVREQNLVTYLGTYRVRSSYPLVFQVGIAVPEVGSLQLEFDDQTPLL